MVNGRVASASARLHLADLLAAGDESGLARAAELYMGLCGEEPEDERLWMGLFRVYERAGSLLGLGSAERRLRLSLVEPAPGGSNADPDTVALPPKLERLLPGDSNSPWRVVRPADVGLGASSLQLTQ